MSKPFSETKVGQFLSKTAPNILGTVGDALPSNGVFGIVKNLISTHPIMTDAEKTEALKLAEQDEIEFERLNNENTQNARQREIDIANSGAGWISKNITPMLAITIVVLCFGLWIMVILASVPADKEKYVLFILGSLSAMTAQILNYYFGSSSGSKAKQDQLNKLTDDLSK